MKYQIEFTYTVEVDASDACEAWEKAEKEVGNLHLSDAYVYIDGNLVS